jgi:ATP/ADP translocase
VLPAAFCENLLEQAGPRFAGPIAILRNWTYCLFYVMAELWGSVVVSVLFWGFANQVRLCALWRAAVWCCGVVSAPFVVGA